MSSAPVRGIVPQRQRRHHHHHHHHHDKHQRRHASGQNECPVNNKLPAQQQQPTQNNTVNSVDSSKRVEVEEKRPKVNPIFLWAAQREQRIVEVRCEDYDKRNRIKLTKTPQGWRSIPRTALTAYSTTESVTEDEGEQLQENLSTTTKNEEKENSSRERVVVVEIKPVAAAVDEDTRVNDASQLDGKADECSEEDRERHRRKRKKHAGELSKSKRRKTDSEPEEPASSEALVSTNWKMKKRRKFDKNKKRKRLCLEEDIIGNNKLDDTSELKIKQESKKDVVDSVAEVKKIEDIDTTDETEFKMEIKKPDKNSVGSSDEQKKCENLEKLQNNRCLQPRVVLEQLHLSQLPTRVHRRLANSRTPEQTNNAEQCVEGRNNADEMVEDNVENSSHVNNESRINPDNNEEAVVDKEDLQEILNMLDSSHFPININETNTSLIGSKDLPRSCTKLGATILSDNQNDEITMKECDNREHEMTASEKRSKFGERLNAKHRVGSKSLDETIERLERSINWQKKLGSLPNVSTIEEDDVAKQKANTLESEINDKKYNRQKALAVREDAYEEHKTNKDIIESTKILDALRNTPGLSISLATNGRKHNALIDATTNLSKIMSCSRSPDSQAEVAEKVGKPLPGLSIAVPVHPLVRPKTASPALKNRVESPESTVDFSKQEQCPCETNDEDCHSQAVDETKNQNIFKSRHTMKCNRQTHGDYHQAYCDDGKDYSMNCSKIPNLKPIVPVVSRNSEAQAKYSNLPRYQEVDDYDEHLLEDFNSQVSPQPSGIPYSISSSRRSSSAYLERLLPSPPCSVSCSEDAKNDLTLKSILSSSINIDSRNLDSSRKDQPMDLNTHCDSELSPSYDHLEQSESHLQQKANYPEMRDRRRPMSSGDVHSQFAADYIPAPKRPMSAEWTANQQRMQSVTGCYPNNIRYANEKEFVSQPSKVQEVYSTPTIFLDPASQLRELIKTSGHLIPDPLLVPRDYLPLLAGAPLTEIPKLLATRPELRLPEALTRPELLRDPDLLVISLAHLQHVLDHGDGSVNKTAQQNLNPTMMMMMPSPTNESSCKIVAEQTVASEKKERPKLISCKPIGKLMPAPMDLSSNHKVNLHPPLLRVRSGLLKQEPEVSSTASSPDDSQLWHPLFGR